MTVGSPISARSSGHSSEQEQPNQQTDRNRLTILQTLPTISQTVSGNYITLIIVCNPLTVISIGRNLQCRCNLSSGAQICSILFHLELYTSFVLESKLQMSRCFGRNISSILPALKLGLN